MKPIKIAIYFSTHYGQTRTIAYYMKEKLSKVPGVKIVTEVYEINKKSPIENLAKDVDYIFIGSPVYRGNFLKYFVKWVRDHKSALTAKKTAFFSVSLNAIDKRPECRIEDEKLIRKFINLTGWTPDYVASLGGALNYVSYNWFIRIIMKKISSAAGGPTDTTKNFELTDWAAVDSFLNTVLGQDIKLKTNYPDAELN